MTTSSLIIAALLLPLIGAVLIVLSDRRPNVRETVTMVTSLLLLLDVILLLSRVLGGERPELTLWQMSPGFGFYFSIEPLGMLFAGIAAFLWPVNSLYSIGYMRGNNEQNQTRFYVCFAIALMSVMGMAFAGNLLTLFIFYEVLTLSTYPLVTHKGDAKAVEAGRVYLGILMVTSIGLLLPAILWTWLLTGTIDFAAGGMLQGYLDGPLVGLMLLMYIFGIGKAAIMPVQRWLPAAMVAPTPVSALLHAVAVVKAGVFCVVKVVVYVFGLELLQSQPSTHWLIFAAAITIIIASIIALREDNLKRRLAYSTVSQLSYVVLATAILAPLSIVGACLHIVAHAFGKITLFFAAGSIYTASHKTEVSELAGIGRQMPWTMGAFAVASLSMVGVPPMAGFLSKWYMLLGALETEQMVAVAVLVISTLLNAAYFLPIVYYAFFRMPPAHGGGTDHDGDSAGRDAPHGEAPFPIVLAVTVTAAGTVLLFFWPDVPLTLAQLVGEAAR